MLPPKSPTIDLGSNGLEDWKWDGSFHQTDSIHSLEVDGQSISLQNSLGFEQNFSQSLKFSIILPARNLSIQSWNCGAENMCYRGGLNFETTGDNSPHLSQKSIGGYKIQVFLIMSPSIFLNLQQADQTHFKLYSLNYISGFKHTISINTSLSELFVPNDD